MFNFENRVRLAADEDRFETGDLVFSIPVALPKARPIRPSEPPPAQIVPDAIEPVSPW